VAIGIPICMGPPHDFHIDTLFTYVSIIPQDGAKFDIQDLRMYHFSRYLKGGIAMLHPISTRELFPLHRSMDSYIKLVLH
jgi:hypothetical protein